MKLSTCFRCKQPITGTCRVYFTGYGVAEVVGPMVSFDVNELETLEHEICPEELNGD